MKRIISVMLTLALVLSFVVNTFAAENKQAEFNNQSITAEVEKGKEIQKAIKDLEKYVNRLDDGTFQLNAPENVKSQISDDVFSQIQTSMNNVNEYIKEGTLVSTPNLSVYNPKDINFNLQDGVNQVLFYWWGFQPWMNHVLTYNVIMALNQATVTALIVSSIPALTPYGAIVGAWCYWQSNLLSWNDAGRGVVMSYLYGATNPFWYAGQ